jgi:predicted N-acetyltransferase YhbS
MSPKVLNRPVTPADLPLIAKLHAEVFGPGRFTRTAYRVRERRPGAANAVSRFCRAAFVGDRLVAAVRFTEITVGGREGALLLGPLAVAADIAGQGYGRALVAQSLEEARKAKVRLVLLVGDEPYYGRFGFGPVPPGQITLPGPVNPARLLAAEPEAGALADYRGLVSAA